MPTLRELLNPATADAQLAANPPERSGYSSGRVAGEVARNPGINVDAAIGNIAGRGAPREYLSPIDGMSSSMGGGTGMSEQEARKIWAANGNNATGWNKNADGTWSGPAGGMAGQPSTFMDRINAAFGQFKPKSEDDIIKEETSMIQDQINAINSVFDRRVADATEQGRGRIGQTRALNTEAGTAFSPMGSAAITDTEKKNQGVIDAINAERLMEISNLMAAARGAATKRIESQVDRFIGLANDQVAALAQAYGLSAEEEQNLRENALARARLTGTLDEDPTLELRQFLADEAQRREQNSFNQRELDARIREAEAMGQKVIQGDDGTVMVYDPFTGKTTNLGRFSRPGSGGSGSGPYAQDSFYDLIISDLASGTTNYNTILSLYGPDVAKAVDNRIRELRKNGRDPFAPLGSSVTPGSPMTGPNPPIVPDRLGAPAATNQPTRYSFPEARIGADGRVELYTPGKTDVGSLIRR